MYKCPNCSKNLILKNKSYVCENNHSFDSAKSGYVNLILPNKKHSAIPGDNLDMINARINLMKYGYYNKLKTSIIMFLNEYLNGQSKKLFFLDLGCGEGELSRNIKDAFNNFEIFGVDISKIAINSCSKISKNINYAVASCNQLPFFDNSFDIVLNAFAPNKLSEVYRIIKNDGIFIKIIPASSHLMNLKKVLYQNTYLNIPPPEVIDNFELLNQILVEDTFDCPKEQTLSLIKMTPYYYKTPKDAILNLQNKPLSVNLEFLIRIYKKSKILSTNI